MANYRIIRKSVESILMGTYICGVLVFNGYLRGRTDYELILISPLLSILHENRYTIIISTLKYPLIKEIVYMLLFS